MRVLIAEDDPVIGMGLAERLRELGHEPIGPAGDGHGAIALALADPPDLYLFDVDLPGLDGLAAATWLADAGLRRPIVVVTGIDDADVIERSVANGAGAYLTKPVDTRELEAAVQSGSYAARRAPGARRRRRPGPPRARGAQDHRARKRPADVGAPALGSRRLPPAPAHRARA